MHMFQTHQCLADKNRTEYIRTVITGQAAQNIYISELSLTELCSSKCHSVKNLQFC